MFHLWLPLQELRSLPEFTPSPLGPKNQRKLFLHKVFSRTLRVMDVRAENRGRPHQKVRFPAAPVVRRNFLTPGHSGVRVRNVRGKSGPKSLCLYCFSSLTPNTRRSACTPAMSGSACPCRRVYINNLMGNFSCIGQGLVAQHLM